MARFIAIHTVPGITEDQFNQVLSAVRKWRPDSRTTILKAYCNLAEGKLVTECEAADQSHFEEWIRQVGWPADAIHQVDLVHQVGHMWKL